MGLDTIAIEIYLLICLLDSVVEVNISCFYLFVFDHMYKFFCIDIVWVSKIDDLTELEPSI